MLCWLDSNSSLNLDSVYLLKHTSRVTRAKIDRVNYRLDVSDLHRRPFEDSLHMNDIARVTLRTTEPLMCDNYETSRTTGSFILIDSASGATVAAGMLLPPRR